MTLDEFRRHPAYDYYIRTLVSNCLICELDNKFDYKYKNIVYIKPNFENETKDYIIHVPREIIEESEEYIQPCNYCPLARYLCLGIDCRAVILKQVKYEKK